MSSSEPIETSTSTPPGAGEPSASVSSASTSTSTTTTKSSGPSTVPTARPASLSVSAIQTMVAKSIETAVSESLSGFISSMDTKLKEVMSGSAAPGSTLSSATPVSDTVRLGSLPPTSVLAGLGVASSDSTITAPSTTAKGSIATIKSVLGTSIDGSSCSKGNGMIIVTEGIPALKKWLVESIVAGECVDLAEFPPAKGRSKAPRAAMEGQLILMQASEFLQTKKLIPDLATWIQCFSTYTAVVVHHHPERIVSMLSYMSNIAKLSMKFKWPSWVIYDQTYRQEAAESQKTDWSKIDASIHAQCFNGMAKSAESWCRHCHSLDHLAESCSFKPSTSTDVVSVNKKKSTYASEPPAFRPICKKFNKYGGDCSFGASCDYRHICSRCKGAHPKSKCPRQAGEARQNQ